MMRGSRRWMRPSTAAAMVDRRLHHSLGHCDRHNPEPRRPDLCSDRRFVVVPRHALYGREVDVLRWRPEPNVTVSCCIVALPANPAFVGFSGNPATVCPSAGSGRCCPHAPRRYSPGTPSACGSRADGATPVCSSGGCPRLTRPQGLVPFVGSGLNFPPPARR
jgi:hypothetical protein